MVAQNTLRPYGIKQEFRFVEGIWLHRMSRRIRIYFGKDLPYFICAQHGFGLPCYISTMDRIMTILSPKNFTFLQIWLFLAHCCKSLRFYLVLLSLLIGEN